MTNLTSPEWLLLSDAVAFQDCYALAYDLAFDDSS